MEKQLIPVAYALDTLYLLLTGALVMWMAAGFAMLEAGLVRSKNTVEILTKNVLLFAIACVMYLLIGYKLMYPDQPVNALWPGIGFLIGPDHTVEAVVGSQGEIVYSKMADFFFQVVFVATAMSIVSGAVAERMRLIPFLIFALFLTGFIYPLQGYWKWGGGFLDQIGYLDFAGSGVVHLCGASAALAGVLLLGPRLGKYGPGGEIHPIPGANIPLAALGTFILWLGWFGFNGGSELKISDVGEANTVARVIVNTNLAACGGAIAAFLTDRLLFGKVDLTMTLNGTLAGLVGITAEPSTPSPLVATAIGAVAGMIVVLSILAIDRLRIDDPVGAISVHGTCGIWGVLAVPLTNPEASFVAQLAGAVTIFGWVFTASLIVWALLKFTLGIRLSPEDEYNGADYAECAMEAYPEFTGGVLPHTARGEVSEKRTRMEFSE